MYLLSEAELDLLKGLAAGERKATERIYRQHFPVVRKWIRTSGGGDPDAADVFQEAMVVLFEKVGSGNFTLSCKIGTYLFAVSRNLWYKKCRSARLEVGLPDEAYGDEDNTGIGCEEDMRVHMEREAHFSQLGASMEQLGEPCRSLLYAFYQQGRSMKEIADGFGYTNPDNAKTQKYKCLTRLRKIFYGLRTG